MKLVDALNGGYAGLYGEVVTADIYRLRSVQFQPDVIFDIGANIGIFSRFARSLFPKARIIALEPHPENCAVFREHTQDENTLLIQNALGNGHQVYHGTTARNGSGETYLSTGLGYPVKDMIETVESGSGLERSGIDRSVRFHELIHTHRGDGPVIAKIDCEGAENTIWESPYNRAVLATIDYICMEIHPYALHGAELPKVLAAQDKAIEELKLTHHCKRDGVHLWAIKK